MAFFTRKHKRNLRKVFRYGLDLVLWLILALLAFVKSLLMFFRDFFGTLYRGIREIALEELASLEEEREQERRMLENNGQISTQTQIARSRVTCSTQNDDNQRGEQDDEN